MSQYDLDTPRTPLENAYEQFAANIKDPVQKQNLINQVLGTNNIKPHPTKEDLISLFNPNADFINSYNQRTLKQQIKNEKRKNQNY